MQRSKKHFLDANLAQTGARIDESRDIGAAERRRLIVELFKPKDKACCSLGCGLGRFLRGYVTQRAKIVVGLDINRGNLERCKEIGGHLVLGDIENVPFQDGLFDIIDCEATMEHISEPTKAMREINRIVKRKIGVSFVTWHIYNWTRLLTDRWLRLRFILYIRDQIVNIVHIGRLADELMKNRLLKVFFFDYGTYRNAGYSYPEIQRIYKEAMMRIVILKIYHHVVFIASKKVGIWDVRKENSVSVI